MDIQSGVLLCFLLISGGFGVIFNASFLIVNLAKRNFKLDYCYFVYNLAFANLIYNINLVTLQAIVVIGGLDAKSVICAISGYILVTTALIGIINQAILALNRYFLLFHPKLHATFFKTPWIKLSYMLITYVVICLVSTIYFLWGDYGRFDGLCCAALREIEIWHFIVLFIVPAALSYSTCVYVAVQITKLIRHQTDNSTKNDRIVQSRIKEAKSIVKFIALEIGLPMLLETPVLTSVVLNRYVIEVPILLDTVFCGLFIVHTAMDPVITVMVIKPFRRDFLCWFNRVFKKTNNVHPSSTAPQNQSPSYGEQN